ncbi:MAG: ATP-binding cassette domain-containing protein [Clostridia bacterium]|nr:ATP-binding cassette domain-containing protein [Clostridia bacterium]
MNLIEARSVVLAYDGRTAVSNLTFDLEEGDYLCVVGENGSGKSTLLRAITGDITPAGGKLLISPVLKKHGIGYLPQQTAIQRDFPATVEEVVLSGCVKGDSFGLSWKRESKKRAAEAMELLKISSLSKTCIGELSGGQRQKVLLARAMCASDRLLLLDEPTTGLDPASAHELYETIGKINEEKHCAIVSVTHDIQCALEEARHVLSLCRGHYYFGTVEGYRAHELHDAELDHSMHHHHREEEPVQ